MPWTCPKCGRTLQKVDRPTKHKCITPSSRGLGDTIAKMTSAVGIKPCGGCKKRQAALNKLVPYGKDKNGDQKSKG